MKQFPTTLYLGQFRLVLSTIILYIKYQVTPHERARAHTHTHTHTHFWKGVLNHKSCEPVELIFNIYHQAYMQSQYNVYGLLLECFDCLFFMLKCPSQHFTSRIGTIFCFSG